MKSPENQNQNNPPDVSWLDRWEQQLAFDYGYDTVEEMDTAELSIVQHLREYIKQDYDGSPTEEGT